MVASLDWPPRRKIRFGISKNSSGRGFQRLEIVYEAEIRVDDHSLRQAGLSVGRAE
jgi:hypothetical protein